MKLHSLKKKKNIFIQIPQKKEQLSTQLSILEQAINKNIH